MEGFLRLAPPCNTASQQCWKNPREAVLPLPLQSCFEQAWAESMASGGLCVGLRGFRVWLLQAKVCKQSGFPDQTGQDPPFLQAPAEQGEKDSCDSVCKLGHHFPDQKQAGASGFPASLSCFSSEAQIFPGLPSAVASELCPRHLDCTLQRRKECPLGSHACGPCLPQFFEDGEGRCVTKTGAPKGQTAVVPNPEEEIDLVSDALAKQGRGPLPHSQEESLAPTGQHSRNGASKAESSQSGQRGWPDTSSHPTTEPVHNPPVESTHISSNDALVLGLIVVCTVAGVAALVVATICWCRLQREIQLAQKADYPANKLPQLPSDKLSPGDRKLAQSAQMYHYQHQKQQMLSLEKNKEEAKAAESVSSDEENEDGDFTVYECPGLAPTGEMEVKNPLFDDSTLPPKLHP